MLFLRTSNHHGTRRVATVGLALLCSLFLFAAEVRGEEGPTAIVADGTPPAVATLEVRWRAHPDNLGVAMRFQDALLAAGERTRARKVFSAHYQAHRKNRRAAFLHGRATGTSAGLRFMYNAMRSDFLGVPASNATVRVAILRSLCALPDDDAPRRARSLDALAALVETSDAWHDAGEQWERAGQPKEAEIAYRRAMRHQQPVERARHRMTLLLASTGRVDEAETLARATVDQFPKSSGAHLHLGLVQCIRGRVEDGRASYGRAMEHAGDNADALAALGAAYLEVEDYERARTALGRALTLNDKHLHAITNLAILEIRQGRMPQATSVLARAARLDRRNARVAFLQGVVAERKDNLGKAISRYRRAHRLDGSNAAYPTALAMALVRKGQPQQAIWAMERAISIREEDAGLRLQLGLLYMARRKWREAEDALRTAARLSPKDAAPWFHLAVVRGDHRRNLTGALQALETYEKLGGKEPVALSWLQELRARGAADAKK